MGHYLLPRIKFSIQNGQIFVGTEMVAGGLSALVTTDYIMNSVP